MAIYDSVMVAIARRLDDGAISDPESLNSAYESLLSDESFRDATSRATADNAAVSARLDRATEFIAKAK